MVSLRPYQRDAVGAVFSAWTEYKKVLIVQATGTGKTIVFSAIAKQIVSAGGRVLILAHRGELLDQAQAKLKNLMGLDSALEKAESSAVGRDEKVVVASVQTLSSAKRLEQYDPDQFSTIIIDEAHHAVSDTYMRVIRHFPKAKLLGVTATADRGDKKSLGKVFETIAFEYGMAKAVREGYLCPIKALTIPLSLDISQVRVTSGDYNAGDLELALEPYLEQIAEQMVRFCRKRKTMVFLPLISISQKFAAILQHHGIRAAEVNGKHKSEERRQIIENFASGNTQVLCNSMLLTEGFDCPAVDCVICLRPTKSRGLYTQIIGRGTRLSPETGKKDLLVLDFLWQTTKHDLCRPAYLICEKEEIVKEMQEQLDAKAEQNGFEQIDQLGDDLLELEEKATSDYAAKRERALADELEAQRKKKAKLVDPLQFAMSIEDENLAYYEPAELWEFDDPTEKQITALEAQGIRVDPTMTKGKANMILNRLRTRQAEGMATPKQIRTLERMGFTGVGSWSKADATKMIGRCVQNHWHAPCGINPKSYRPEATEPAGYVIDVDGWGY